MAERIVVWTDTAARQRREILKYWTMRNGSTRYSEKLIKLIAKRIQVILKHPELYKSTDYPGTRVSSMGHYSIFYKMPSDQIIITAFWDNRQDPKKLMETIKSSLL
jgi:plasmid stabilization system protein ParE